MANFRRNRPRKQPSSYMDSFDRIDKPPRARSGQILRDDDFEEYDEYFEQQWEPIWGYLFPQELPD